MEVQASDYSVANGEAVNVAQGGDQGAVAVVAGLAGHGKQRGSKGPKRSSHGKGKRAMKKEKNDYDAVKCGECMSEFCLYALCYLRKILCIKKHCYNKDKKFEPNEEKCEECEREFCVSAICNLKRVLCMAKYCPRKERSARVATDSG